jgi:hypothetical protein
VYERKGFSESQVYIFQPWIWTSGFDSGWYIYILF